MPVDTTSELVRPVVAFPKASVQTKLQEALMESARIDAQLKGAAFPADTAAQMTASVCLDSLDVVSLLCDIEPIVGFELKDNLVRAGGYLSVSSAMDHLLPRIEQAWTKNQSKGVKK